MIRFRFFDGFRVFVVYDMVLFVAWVVGERSCFVGVGCYSVDLFA